ncbi:replication initiator protein A [Lactococcus carnosus]|uniref:replication initiator protein A n=1 Tax=Pseudolactococcus carnosus TaxID=2749961 RepID=UPI001FBBCC12|nr:replication initiator protein A [Lactococcus carnosus]MCJ2003159.1 replication initiator protein A [Lactococcus carnosus]
MSRISLNQVESSERFYRIPKVFTDENSYYCTMRLESKFAYGLLKDRFELSIKNKWVDKEKNIYLIFTVKELEKVLGCKKDKVHQIKRELAQYGLLEEERQGLNKPNRIYVLNIDTMRTSEKPTSNEARTRLESAVVDDDMLSDLATARQKIRHTKGNVQTAKSAAKYTGKATRWLGGRGYGLGNRTYNKFKGYGFKRTPKAMSIPHLAADSIRKRLVRLKRSKTGKVTGRTVKVLKILSNPFVNFLKNPLGLTGLLSLGFGVILIAIITSVVAMFSTTSQSDFDLSDSWKLMTYYDREKSTDKADYYTQLDDVMIYANAKNDDYQPTAPHKFKVKKGDWLSKNGTYGDWLESLWDKLDGNPDNLKVPADIYSDDKESNDFTFDKAELTDFKERLEAVTEDGGGKYPQLLELENPLYLSNDTNNYNAPLKVIKRFGYASKDKKSHLSIN